MLGLGRKKKSKDEADDLQKKNTVQPEDDVVPEKDISPAKENAGADASETLAKFSQEESAAHVGDSKGASMVPDEAGQAVRDAVLEQITEVSEETTGYTSEEDLLAVLAEQVGMELVKISDYEIEQSVVDMVSPDLARQYKVFPLAFEEETDTIVLAISDPLNVQTLDDLRIWLDHNVRGVIATEEEIEGVISEFYGTGSESVDDVLHELDSQDYNIDFKDTSFGNLEKIVHEAPIVKLVNLILLQAIKDRASDLHVEPFENSLRIRYRVDGILHETVPPPSHLSNAIISRFKVMSGLNIAERRLPQDGRVKLSMADRNVELRVSSLPTVNSESVVMR
ncbi:MAG: GspE/PulE family protein, partial [Candidatus Hinthialibacter sp.]